MTERDPNLTEILKEFNSLQERVSKLENNGNNEIQSSNSIKINDNLELSKIPRIDLSELKLVELYNDCPQILEINAIAVNLTPDSYRQKNSSEVCLEKVANGNYWIIAGQNDEYWLFPHIKLSLNIHKIKTLQRLFNFSGTEQKNFAVTQAAKVNLMPDGEIWKLENKGNLEFTDSSLFKQRSQIENLEQKHQQLASELGKASQQQDLLAVKLQKAGEVIKKYSVEIKTLKYQVSALTQKLADESGIDDKQQELISIYHDKYQNLAEKAIVVSETQDSINQRHSGNSKQVEFVNNTNGIYWIISLENQFYLVPDRTQIQINEYSLRTIAAMFKYSNYQSGKSQHIELIKPAKVTAITKNVWQLLEKGILKFKNDDVVQEIDNDEFDWEEFDRLEITPIPVESQAVSEVQLIRTITGHSKAVRSLAISSWNAENAKQILASGSFDQTIKLWELNSGEAIGTLTAGEMVNALALTPDGKTLIASSTQNSLEVWNLHNAKRTILGEHTDWIFSLVPSLDNQIIASCSRDETIKIWDLETHQLKQTLTDNRQGALAIAIAPDNCTLVSSCGDKAIRVWNLETSTVTATYCQPDLIWSMAITPDGKTLICGSRDCTIYLIDLNTGAVKSTLKGHSQPVWCLAMIPDGKTLASGSGDRTIKLWKIDTGELITTLNEHTDEVYTLAIASDGRTLASGSRDSTIKIWQLRV
jgi:WD40 repeat protein